MIAVGKNIFRIAAICLSSVAMGTVAMGATPGASPQTTTMMVTATVVSSCSVSAGTMAFPNYDGSADVTQSAVITATCSTITPPSVALGGGSSGTTMNARYMSNTLTPVSHLNYTLWHDSTASTTPWNAGIPQVMPVTSATDGTSSITVYGRIAASQRVAPGTDYSDSVLVTLTF